VCFIVDGRLEVIKESMEGKENTLATLKTGQAIEEMALIDGLPCSTTVRACTQSALAVLSNEGFDALLEQSPMTGIKILQHLARGLSPNLRRTSNKLTDSMEIDC
tara:strand:- start:4177 stop:4491 length:315 start_codon:yes stop_codon:yes gene_type:complete